MHSSLGRMKNVAQSSNPGDIKNFTESRNEADCKLFKTIYSKVTKKNHRRGSPQVGTDKTLKRCIDLFEKGADPKVLTQLEEVLEARQDEPTIAKHIQQSNQVNSPKTPDKLKESLKDKKENYSYYTQHFLPVLKEEIMKSEKLAKLPVFNKETEQSQGPETRKGEIVGIILDITSRSKDKSHPSKKATEQINVAEENDDKEPAEETTVTPEFSNSGGSDSGVSSPELNEKSLESPASSPISVTSTSSQESLDLTLSSAEEDDNPQIEETKSQEQPGQTVEQVKENENSDGRADRDIKDPVKEKPQPGTLMTDGHRNSLQSEEKNRENATVQEPSVNRNNRDSNGKSSPVKGEKDVNSLLYETIRAKVTKKNHQHVSPQVGKDGTLKKCIELFEQGADPNELIKLEKFLSDKTKGIKEYKEYHDYYIQHFLPALKEEIMKPEKLFVVLDNTKVEQPQRSTTKRGEILEIIRDIINNKSSNKNHPSGTQEQSTDVAEGSGDKELTVTSELSDGSGLDSGVGSDKRSTTSTSSEESLDLTPSSVEGNSSLRKEETKSKVQPEQTAKKEPEVSFQHVTLESREKEPWIPVSSTGMTDGHSNPWQFEEKKDSTTTVQNTPANKNNSKGMPQSNNRDLYKGFATGCAGLAVGCLIAGVITLGAGLFVMAAVFAIAAIATRYLTPPSSELTSTTLSPLVDAKQR
ncbi:MAG: hypothetical protein ACR5K9_01995 [Wolbachia sp.]